MPRGEADAAVIGISAAVVYDVISATNSSPQTTEINAAARAPTLMKWVNIGLAQGALFVVIMMIAEPPGKKWRPVVGGGLAGVLLWTQYIHAKNAGLKSSAPPTETYGNGSRPRGRVR
jgi:hypothetical protein